jgi:TPR repeat protein
MKDLHRILSLTLLLFTLSMTATAQLKPPAENKQQVTVYAGNEYKQQGDKALQEKRLDDAVRLFEKAADAGDGNAMRFLGNTYYSGRLRTQDFQKARLYYEKAEAIGYLGFQSANYLGVIYADGLGVKRTMSAHSNCLRGAPKEATPGACSTLLPVMS